MTFKKTRPSRDPAWAIGGAIREGMEKVFGDFESFDLLLDIGCGAMPYRDIYLTKARKYIGLDIKAAEPGDGRVIGDVFNLPFTNESFDAVVSSQVIEHVADPDGFIREISRVLKRNGTVIITAPKMARTHGQPYDFFRFTEFGLKHLLEKNRFEIDFIRPHGGIYTTLAFLLNFYLAERWNWDRSIKGRIARLFMRPIFYITNTIGKLDDKRGGNIIHCCNFMVVAKKSSILAPQ